MVMLLNSSTIITVRICSTSAKMAFDCSPARPVPRLKLQRARLSAKLTSRARSSCSSFSFHPSLTPHISPFYFLRWSFPRLFSRNHLWIFFACVPWCFYSFCNTNVKRNHLSSTRDVISLLIGAFGYSSISEKKGVGSFFLLQLLFLVCGVLHLLTKYGLAIIKAGLAVLEPLHRSAFWVLIAFQETIYLWRSN